MRLLSIALLVLLIAFSANAQTHFTLRGTVVNEASQQPLQAASVYAQNTTYGTVTDAEGNFSLTLPSGGYDIVVSYSDKQNELVRVTANDATKPLNFSLKDKQKELETVAVVASNEVKDGLAKYGNFFNDNFIGKSTLSTAAKIRNPEVLKFFYSKRRDRLKVMADEPLLIDNHTLGYTIKYSLDSFVYEYKTNACIYTGNPFFTAMESADSSIKANWAKNRNDAFFGSPLHFMRSLNNKRIEEDGFEVSFIQTYNGKEQQVMLKNIYNALNFEKNDSTGIATISPKSKIIGVVYNDEKPEQAYLKANPTEPKDFQFSFITLQDSNLHIEQNGYFYEQADVLTDGYWNWKKVGEMLPYDFVPTEGELN